MLGVSASLKKVNRWGGRFIYPKLQLTRFVRDYNTFRKPPEMKFDEKLRCDTESVRISIADIIFEASELLHPCTHVPI